MNRTGITLVALSVLSWLATWLGWSVPVLKLFDLAGHTAGNVLRLLALIAGGWLVLRPVRPANPLSAKRWKRFRSIRRGYVSFIILIALCGVALMDNVIAGKRALFVSHDGHWYFPAFLKAP